MKKTILSTIAIFCLAALSASPALAWDGYDWEEGADITIESGNLVRPGEEIEYFDWDEGEYRYGSVESVQRIGGSVEVEVYDYNEGEYRVLEMYD